MIKKISVLIPVYNEELYVEEVLKALRALSLPHHLQREIIVIDDGSTDRTRKILENYDSRGNVKICYLDHNFGKGAAIREGLRHVTGDVVVIQDADLEYSVEDYPQLLEPFISGNAQAVYGSRFLGEIKDMKLANRVFNLIIRQLANWLFHAHLTDEATAYKLLTTELIRSLDLKSQRFEICPEITSKLLRRNIRIHEVPVRYRARNKRQGKKISWTDAFAAIFTLLKYRWSSPA